VEEAGQSESIKTVWGTPCRFSFRLLPAPPPNSGNSYNVRNVNTSGALNNNNAYNGNRGVRPLRWITRSSRPQAESNVPPSKEGVSRPLLSTAGTNTGLPIPEHCSQAWPRLYTARRFFDMTDFEKVYNFENLYRAYRKARRGKRWKGAAAKFEVNLLEALNLLSVQLQSHTYRLSPYNTFKVYEPKERVVMSNSYKDKVVQHALCDNVLEPRVRSTFIKDNYASQVGKGTHFGLERLEGFMRRFYRVRGVDGWVLKCDISKYFYNIKHDALKSLIRKYISDPDCLWLLDMIIDSTEGNVGIPIGNQSSQIFALLYLSSLDHMVKEKLGIKFYGRYMDDFYLIHEDKEYLRYCWKEIERHVNELGLSLNAKTNIYPLKNGIDFLGFHSYLTESGAVIRKVRRKSKNNARRRLTKMRGLLETGKITPEKVEQSYKSWRGHASKGNCYHLIRNMDQHYNKLFGQYAVAGNRGGVAVSEEKEEGKECRKS
jgi:retron-type reverse transcriptase